ncbi:hypothetical protein FRACYDRAFT_268192 [Fragilariopsis cylindrus CCMP1102]|uniref:Uncharacterized protein n=1 Tax=Fragilariopsis cylindrus CCMP1102 TaxID=635003 RepID=A0A1E7FPQ9_9STRA|nr:hypothetical protein FRACYDRAFT_268192 [Fragilariopsis cylindrus CCMP1102]|eukprot:OEU20160.1 hypothetical protein FRACYDRAFT_268192 [Fragilariopsis cylindrus CCMP1102]
MEKCLHSFPLMMIVLFYGTNFLHHRIGLSECFEKILQESLMVFGVRVHDFRFGYCRQILLVIEFGAYLDISILLRQTNG